MLERSQSKLHGALGREDAQKVTKSAHRGRVPSQWMDVVDTPDCEPLRDMWSTLLSHCEALDAFAPTVAALLPVSRSISPFLELIFLLSCSGLENRKMVNSGGGGIDWGGGFSLPSSYTTP